MSSIPCHSSISYVPLFLYLSSFSLLDNHAIIWLLLSDETELANPAIFFFFLSFYFLFFWILPDEVAIMNFRPVKTVTCRPTKEAHVQVQIKITNLSRNFLQQESKLELEFWKNGIFNVSRFDKLSHLKPSQHGRILLRRS